MRSFVVCLCAGLVLSLVHVSSAGPPGGGQGGKGGSGQGFEGNGDGPPGKGSQGFGGLGGPGGQKGPPGQGGPPGQHGNGGGPEGMLQQIMSLDANGDGALTPAEVTDPRLQQMLKQADVNGNGAVTREELMAAMHNQGGGPQGGGGPGGGGQGGGGHGGPARPGEILPGFVQDQLQLTDAQRQQLATLQAQVDAQLAQILTAQQVQQLAAGPPMGGPGGRQQAVNQNGNSSSRSKSGRSGRNNKQ
jgi:hypothetical protein